MGIPAYMQEHLRAAAMMRGRLQSTQVCPKCKARGRYTLKTYDGVTVLECTCGRWAATKGFRVRIGHLGKDLHIYHSQAGHRFASLEQAQTALETMRGEIKRGTFDPELWKPTSPLVWENYIEEYLKREAARTAADDISSGTLRKKGFFKKHLAGLNGHNIREIDESHLLDLAAKLRHLAPKTRADIFQELNHIFKEAHQRRKISRVPAMPNITVIHRTPRWLTPEQQKAVLEQIPEIHQPIYRFMMLYGCRPGEACAMMWDQVHVKEGYFVLSRTYSEGVIREGTKQRRDVPLPLVGWFADWLRARPGGFPGTLVFVNPKARTKVNERALAAIRLTREGVSGAKIAQRLGVTERTVRRWRAKYKDGGESALYNQHQAINDLGGYLPGYIRDELHAACDAAGVPRVKLKNATRHSVANQLLRNGADRKFVQDWLGHSDGRMINMFYGDNSPNFLAQQWEQTQGRTHHVHTGDFAKPTSDNN